MALSSVKAQGKQSPVAANLVPYSCSVLCLADFWVGHKMTHKSCFRNTDIVGKIYESNRGTFIQYVSSVLYC